MATKVDNVKIRMSAEGEAAVASSLKGVDSQISGLATAVKGLGGLFVAQQLGQFLGASIKEAAESEKVYTRLAATMNRLGMSYSVLRTDVERFTNEMKDSSHITDEDAANALNRLLKVTNDYSLAQQGVRAAVDLSADGTVEFEAAISAMTKAGLGSVDMFKRYGVKIDENIPKGEEFETVVRNINAQFGGTALTNLQTTAGKVEQLGKAWKDFQEAAGKLVTAGGDGGVLGSITTYLNNLSTALDSGRNKFVLFSQIFASEMIRWGSSSKLLAIIAKEQKDVADQWARNMKAMFPDAGKGTGSNETVGKTMEEIAAELRALNAEIEKAWKIKEKIEAKINGTSLIDRPKIIGGPNSIEMESAEVASAGVAQRAWEASAAASRSALRQFHEEAEANAARLAEVMTGFATRFTDAFVDGIFGMKQSVVELFKQMVTDMIKQLLRLAVFKFLINLILPGSGALLPTGPGGLPGLPGGLPFNPAPASGLTSSALGAPVNITVNGGVYPQDVAMAIITMMAKASRFGGLNVAPRTSATRTGVEESIVWNLSLRKA